MGYASKGGSHRGGDLTGGTAHAPASPSTLRLPLSLPSPGYKPKVEAEKNWDRKQKIENVNRRMEMQKRVAGEVKIDALDLIRKKLMQVASLAGSVSQTATPPVSYAPLLGDDSQIASPVAPVVRTARASGVGTGQTRSALLSTCCSGRPAGQAR